MSIGEVFKEYYSILVETLPMSDATFVSKLYTCDLLPGDLRNSLNLLHRTSAEKAAIFLDSVIGPSVRSGVGSSFNKLISVMEDSDHQDMKELAKLIRTNLRKRPSSSDNG